MKRNIAANTESVSRPATAIGSRSHATRRSRRLASGDRLCLLTLLPLVLCHSFEIDRKWVAFFRIASSVWNFSQW